MDMELITWDKARHAIAQAKTIDDVKGIRDKAQAMKAYFKQIGETLEVQNDIADIKIRAERRAGEMLRDSERQKPGEHWQEKRSHDVTVTPKLSDIGISKIESSRWQKIAQVPEDKFEQHIETTKRKKYELTSKTVLQLADNLALEKARQENEKQIESYQPRPPIKNHYQTIVADPPWDVSELGDNQVFGRSVPGYAAMTIAEIKAEDIGKFAAENCHLYLWVINRMIFEVEAVLKAWGFRYVTMLTWVKPSIGRGNYFRNNTEHILFGVKGSLALLRHDVRTWFNAARGPGGHSSKPDEFYKSIQTCSPGPRLDYFARNERQGWDIFSAEI